MSIPIGAGNFSQLMRGWGGVEMQNDPQFSYSSGSTTAISIWGSDDGLIVVHTGSGANGVRHGEYPPPTTWYTAPTVTTPISGAPRHIYGLSRTQIWIAYETGVMAWDDGTSQYNIVHTFTATDKARVVAFADDDVWVMCRYELWHWNGSTWTDRIGDIPETTSILRSLRRVGTDMYLMISPNGVNTGKIYKRTSGGVWSVVATEATKDYPQDMWVFADDDVWVVYDGVGGSNLLDGKRWNGATWISFTAPAYSLFDAPQAEDIVGVAPGTLYIGWRRSGQTQYGGVAQVHDTPSGIYGRVSNFNVGSTGNCVLSVGSVGMTHLDATYKEGDWDSDGRGLIVDRVVQDVKVIRPSQDPMFGLMGNSFTGKRYDGLMVKDGALTIPSNDISFGTVAGGINASAWNVESPSGKPWLNYDRTAYATTNVDIPSADNELRLSMVGTSVGNYAHAIISSAPQWLIPGGQDFVLEGDLNVTITLTGNEVCYLWIRLYGAKQQDELTDLSQSDVYVPKGNNFWGVTHTWGFWLGGGEFYADLYENDANTRTQHITASKTTHISKFRFTRSGTSITIELWDPAASGGSGAWIGSTYTIGQVDANSTEWQDLVPRIVRFQAQISNNVSLDNFDVRVSNLTLTGVNPIAYDATMRLWRPFESCQGESGSLPDNPTGMVLDKRALSIIDLDDNKMNMRFPRKNAAYGLLPRTSIDGSGVPEFIVDRADYHEGLIGVISRDGRSTWIRGNGTFVAYVSRFMMIDLAGARARRIQPGDDAGTNPGRCGSTFAGESSFNLPMAGWVSHPGLLAPFIRDRYSDTEWDTVASPYTETLPWRVYDGDPRDVAVFRDGSYCYLICAGEAGLTFTKDRPYYEYETPETVNSAHVTTYLNEVIAVAVEKSTGDMAWLAADGSFYYAAKATWQAMDQSSPNASYYNSGFTHTATVAFPGTMSRRSQEKLVIKALNVYVAADGGVYLSLGGFAFSLLYGVVGSGATHEILPTGTTSVDAIAVDDDYMIIACYNGATRQTAMLIVLLTTNTVLVTQDVTDELGGLGERMNCIDVGYY